MGGVKRGREMEREGQRETEEDGEENDWREGDREGEGERGRQGNSFHYLTPTRLPCSC